MLFCAGISGRYYTDQHVVDEDERAISYYNGMWYQNDEAGVTCRYMNTTPSYADITAASRLIYLS